MAKNSSNLVRPRTTIQDTTLSTNPHHNRKRQQHSLQVLFLCGTCMFLVILCICLIVTLVLVSHSLSNGTLLMSICGNTNNTNNNNRTTLPKVENYWSKLFDFATTKVFNNTNALVNSIIGGESGANSEKINPNLSGGDYTQFNLNHNNRTMTTQKISKIVEQLSWRLPQEIKPKFYNLHLHPNLSEKRFTGNVSIEVIVMKPLPFIAVHSKLLNVTSTNLVKNIIGGGNVSIPIANTFDYPKYEYWITELEKPLDVGEYTLSLAFNGSLVDRIVGFYQSSYKDVERNVTRYIATSKFEPTYARQAFPCFDEPSMKAKFEINVVRPLGDGYSALSNMNEESVENDISAQTSTVHFAASVPMSTYLACFIVSDFNFKNRIINVEEKIGKKFELRVFATPAQVDKVEFALDTAANVTQYFIDYFEIEYPLPKLDLVAIPDFVSGAMEHWGLVTFRETALLFDKTSSSTANKHRVAQVVAHELAHMWFGNLVTMSWWNELWLNEGFATYLQYKGMDHAYPEWHVLDQFITETLHDVMNLDATLAAHPIVQVAESPDQITELFDAITYSKGASVIRMLADFVGEEKFRKSVTNYLNAHKYGNAVTDDLLEQIEQIDDSNKDVKHIMSTWTKQSGLPVVMVTKISPTEYLLTQKRFFSNPANEGVKLNDSEFNYRWTIPLTYTTSSNPNELKREWFNHIDLQKKITVSEEDKWIKLNKGQVGYYRVNYAKDEWKTLSSVLLSELQTFSVADRAHLLNDAFSLAEATQLNYGVALDLTRYLNQENDYVPWAVASTKLTGIRKLLSDTYNYYKFLKYARNLIDAPYKMVGWDVDDDESKKQLRVTILGFACSVGHDDCIEEAGKRFSSWLSDPSQRPNADLRSIVYTYGMVANGNEKNWDAVWKLFTTETDAQEKVKLMSSLAAVRDPNLLKRFIGLAWDEKNVRGQDYFGCLTNIAANPVGEIVVWDFVRENWQKLIDRFGLNERYLGRLIPSITSRFSSELKLHDLKEFFANYPDAGAGATARKEAIQKIEYNIQWLKNNEQKVANWLNDNEKNDKWEKA